MGILRRFLQVVLLVLTIVVGLSAAGMIVTQTAWFRDWLRGFIVRQGDQYLNGRLTIGRLGGNIFFGIELEDVAVTMNGEPVVTLKDARIAYSVLQLLTRNLVITSLRLNEPVVHMRRENGGVWELSDLVKQQSEEAKRTGPGLPVAVDDIEITGGSFVFDDRPVGTSGVDVPRMLNRLDARLSFAYAPVHYTIDISKVSFRGQSPLFALNQMSGKVAVNGPNLFLQKVAVRTAASDVKVDGAIYDYTKTPAMDLHVTSDKLDLDEIARIVPPLGRIDLKPALDIVAKGPLNNLGLDLDVRSPRAGDVSGHVVLDLVAPDRRVSGTIHTKNIDVGAIVKKPADATAITGVTRFDLRLLSTAPTGTLPIRANYDVRAQIATAFGYLARDLNARGTVDGNRVAFTAKAIAYGTPASAAGTVTLPAGRTPLRYDLHGTVERADLRQLPAMLKVPRPATRLNLDYHIIGSGPDVWGDMLLHRSMLSGATIDEGTKATFSYRAGQAAYTASGAVSGLDLQRIGQQFRIAALSSSRFASNVNGQFDVSGAGTSIATMRLDANGNLVNSTLFGMTTPQLTFQTALANGTLQAKTSGQFRDLNPATLTGNAAYKGDVAGSFNVSAGMTNLGAPARTTSLLDDLIFNGTFALQPSQVAGIRIDKASFDGQYANRLANVRGLTATGLDLQLKASGPVSFGNQGQSNLTYEVMTPRLERVGKLVDKPLQGAATLTGRLTGNASDLRTTGTVKASNFAYGGTAEALTLTSQYDVQVPGLDAARAVVQATTSATFVKLAGQQINKVDAKTTYGNQSVDFDASLEQPKRSLRTAGNVLLHPDHQEIHLRSLALQSSGASWQLAPGSQPAIQYGGNAIAVKDVRLVSDGQTIEANGTIGTTASDLQARLSNFNLTNVDALMLTSRGLGGVLNAQATVTGPRDALNVAGDFSVNGGSFRTFKYQSLAGKVRYAHDRISVDARLQENPQAWLAANGSVPTSLFTPHPTGAAAAAPVDFRVQSSPLDIGLIQGFTTDVQNATGTAQVDVRLQGTAADPDFGGAVTVTNGAFQVVPTGVAYKDLNSRIALSRDRLTVQQFSITDEHGKTLTMTGDLAVDARQVGAVSVKLQGQDFEVIHNVMGQVALNTNVTLGGQIQQPRITGTLGINTGKINVDKVLDLATSSAYSTTEEAVPTSEGGQPASQPIGQPVNQPAGAAQAEAAAKTKPATPAEIAAQKTAQNQAQAASSGGAFNAAAIDLHITVPDDLVIKGNDIRIGQSSMGMGDVNVTIGGDIHVQKAADAPMRLLGQVQTIRGTYEFQGRRFDIQRGGTVRFGGFQPPNPALDITATRVITGVDTRVHVGGTVRRPELVLSSTPPLDQADILSLIIFGQPSNQLGEGQQVSLAQRAGTIAGGFVASQLAQSIGNALNLDTFEIQTGTDTGETGATVTVGQQVGQRLYVKLRQGVGAESTSEFVLDYQLTNFLRFQSTMQQGNPPTRNIMNRVQQSGADLIFLFSF